eukprot:GHVP01020744.1.p1 GENE.GHVP01020744.1~~GHVP01020744.1.p1  ORF type:complete len:216 (-),score=37.17 GHVP01020744.1:335-982(-)
MKTSLLNITLSGLKNVKRGVIKKNAVKDPKTGEEKDHFALAVEGYGLSEVMAIPGVDGLHVLCNHVMEVKDVLGIEAARQIIINEITKCMTAYSMEIDCRHIELLSDVMTYRGDVLGISRHGIQKMRCSTIMLASFEETNEHLFEAAVHNRKDTVKGVSECIVLGKPVNLGTGAFDLLHVPYMPEKERRRTIKDCLFQKLRIKKDEVNQERISKK